MDPSTSLSLSKELIRTGWQLMTGRLLTPGQIEGIAKDIVELLAHEPTIVREPTTRDRVTDAKVHLANAGNILAELQAELERQSDRLEALAEDIELKRAKAEQYAALASANEPTVAAIQAKLETAVRNELESQSARGRRLRQVLSALAWVITLILGAALGAHWAAVEVAVSGWF